MNTMNDAQVRVKDYTNPQPIKRSSRFRTVTDMGGLFFAWNRNRHGQTELPKIYRRHGDNRPVTLK